MPQPAGLEEECPMAPKYWGQPAAAPTAEGRWTPATVIDERGRPLTILAAPSAAPAVSIDGTVEPITHVICATPRLAVQTDGAPKFALTIVLQRKPQAYETDLRPLIDRAVLGFDATVAPPSSALTQLSAQGEHRLLFPAHSSYRLEPT